MKSIDVFTDGGSRGNPGPAAAAFAIYEEGNLVAKGSKYLGVATNNFAEYSAVIISLEWLLDQDKKPAEVNYTLDSELVVNQLTSKYRVKNPQIKILFDKVNTLIEKLPASFYFKAVPREKNKVADALVNETLDLNK